MALQGKLILLVTADVPGLRHILRVFTHAPAGDAVLHLGHKKSDVGWTQLAKQPDTLGRAAPETFDEANPTNSAPARSGRDSCSRREP
jgi:hypothetical protein